MNLGDYLIRETLRNEYEKVSITHRGFVLHVPTHDGGTRTFVGRNFSKMTQDQIIQYVVANF